MSKYTEIENLPNENLLQLCNDIFNYQKGNGDLNKNSYFYKLFKEIQSKHVMDIRFFESLILDLASKKLDKVVKLLMINRPYFFMKK